MRNECLQVNEYLHVEQSPPLHGEVAASGAKNAVLPIIASLILTDGVSTLTNVPDSSDVAQMSTLLRDLGAQVDFDAAANRLTVDTSSINSHTVKPEIMSKMRASVLVMGPLLARFGRADIALPGGCLLGKRPIDYHLANFERMGVRCEQKGQYLAASTDGLCAARCVMPYASVGATENIAMAAVLTPGTTKIVNASLEPEVLDVVCVLRSMGADIRVVPPATIQITGVQALKPVEHEVMVDRLEAGCLLLAGAVTGGQVTVTNADPDVLDVFLHILEQMGHVIERDSQGRGITIKATQNPKAVSFRTAPYPGFPTDLQAPTMAALLCADGTSVIEEFVYENRLVHVRELQKMGAQVRSDRNHAVVTGVEELFGASVIASDIRASFALVLAGLRATGTTVVTGITHWRRGYQKLEEKLAQLGARIELRRSQETAQTAERDQSAAAQ